MLKCKGMFQGGPESSKLFAPVVADMLLRLTKKWQREGRGIQFGKFLASKEAFHKWCTQLLEHLWYYDPEQIHVSASGLWDDIITMASSMNDTNIMFEDIWRELERKYVFVSPA